MCSPATGVLGVKKAMGELRHFAINADDPKRARRFYERVFSWEFEAWGPPDFYQIRTGGSKAVQGALQKRRTLLPDRPIRGFECTIGVDDIEAVSRAIAAAGGRIVLERTLIPGVGQLLFFEDTEGNFVGAMQYALEEEEPGDSGA